MTLSSENLFFSKGDYSKVRHHPPKALDKVAFLYRRRQWHPTPVLLPGKSHGWRSLVGCSPWGHEQLDTTERLHFHFYALEKEMATHSSVLAWRIPETAEPGGLLSRGRTESDMTAATQQQQQTTVTHFSYYSCVNLCLQVEPVFQEVPVNANKSWR